jgi:hypothetical protein
MSVRAPRFAALSAAVLLTAAALPSAQALSFVFNDAAGTMSAEQLAALQQAGSFWSSKLSDNVTVTINVSFQSLGANILGSTLSSEVFVSYSAVRSGLLNDRKSSLDTSATGSLAAGSGFSFMATQGDGSSLFDNNGTANNTQMLITTANAKAIGLNVNGADQPDATMNFSTDFAFSYTRVGGTPSNKVDFITVAEHEIGHALGFVSGVDFIDGCLSTPASCGLSGQVNEFDGRGTYSILDLYRYSGNGTRDERVGGSPYFSVDGGASSLMSFSTGASHGNGWQASHFGPSTATLMQPTVSFGAAYDASLTDLAAMDAIGWDLTAAVPEPATWALWLAGLGVIGRVARRRQAA